MVQLCYEFQNILIDIIVHSTTLFNHPRIPKHLINFSSIPLVYGAKSQNIYFGAKKKIYKITRLFHDFDIAYYNQKPVREGGKIMG